MHCFRCVWLQVAALTDAEAASDLRHQGGFAPARVQCSRSLTRTHLASLQVMTQLAEQIANMRRPVSAREEAVTALTLMEGSPAPEGSGEAVAALLGDPRDQLAFTILSVLPWLCVHFRHSSHAATAGACTRVRPACLPWAALHACASTA